jgi:hypothetical protein
MGIELLSILHPAKGWHQAVHAMTANPVEEHIDAVEQRAVGKEGS